MRISPLFLIAVVASAGFASGQAPNSPPAQEPPWPQRFEVQGLQIHSLIFAVTQPGPVDVGVQSQGAPVSLVVRGPLPGGSGAAPPQVGVGTLHWRYAVTPQDLQRGLFWQIELRLAQPQGGGHTNGLVTLQRPPVDARLVQQAAQAVLATRHRPTEQERAQASAQIRAQLNADFQARKAQQAQRRAQREAENRARLQPLIDDMRRQAAAAPPAAESDQVRSRGLQPIRPVPPPPPPPPAIVGVNIANNQDTIALPPGSYGQPGDLVTISGTNFGKGGELHFIVGAPPSPTGTNVAGQDLIAANPVWTNTSIVAPVPAVTGVVPYAGGIYIKRSDGAISPSHNFQFEPDMVDSEITLAADVLLDQPKPGFSAVDGSIFHDNYDGVFATANGTDRIFVSTRLQHFWQVSGPAIAILYPESGNVVSAISLGIRTDVLSTLGVFSIGPSFLGGIGGGWDIRYTILIPIRGPKGLSPGVTCQPVTTPGADPCPT
jgi:hypothetical protein